MIPDSEEIWGLLSPETKEDRIFFFSSFLSAMDKSIFDRIFTPRRKLGSKHLVGQYTVAWHLIHLLANRVFSLQPHYLLL